ncbi:MAG: DUF3368 domain-containing protein [Chloroflexi bacterium]|nr:DUF3368 domain-containing protein [Chloroflexota bacterium]
MIVVSNTSPIINLAVVGRLDLLRQLYGTTIIPRIVHDEFVSVVKGRDIAIDIESFDWIETRQVSNQTAVASLQLELDEGEAEAIVLGVELHADLLLLDERKGRAVATRLGLKFIGLLGVLIEAKQKGLIVSIKPILDDLTKKAGFWINSKLYEHVLKIAGE